MAVNKSKLVKGNYYICQSLDGFDLKIFKYDHINYNNYMLYGSNERFFTINFKSKITNDIIPIMTISHHYIIYNLRKATKKEIAQYYNIEYNIKTTLL